MDQTRACTKCGVAKPATAEHFVKRARLASGLTAHCRDCHRAGARRRYNAGAALLLSAARERRLKNPAAVAAIKARHRAKHRDRLKEYCRARSAAYRATSAGALNTRMGSALRTSLRRNKGGHAWPSLVGYSLGELIAHLERQFEPGMGWHNMEKWHIDHIIPVSSFSYETADDAEFSAAWALQNLRPMWARENQSKGARRTHLL